MTDLSQYHLADSFISRANYPKVGESLGELTIIGAWVNNRQTIMGYKLQCSCGEITNFVRVDAILNRGTKKCVLCSGYRSKVHKWFNDNYGTEAGAKLRKLYWKRATIKEVIGPIFDNIWLKDYKAFAEYVVNLEDFDKWPKYQMDRIDNEKGYVKGNIRFVPVLVNANNRSVTRFIEFNSVKYPRAEFIRLITGVIECGTIYNFIASRIDGNRKYHVEQALNELKDSTQKGVWPSEETHQYFLNWYKDNVN